jgi:hypothetical protein
MLNPQKLVDDIYHDLNEIRMKPASYVQFLEERRSHYFDNCVRSGDQLVKSLEGVSPLEELIGDLGIPVSSLPLTWSFELHTTADLFAQDIGEHSLTGHVDSNGRNLQSRLLCRVRGKVAEIIQLSGTDSKEILTELLVDDGLATRSRRRNLLDPDFTTVGIGVAPHKHHGYVTVIILAQKVWLGVLGEMEMPVMKTEAVLSRASVARPMPIKH